MSDATACVLDLPVWVRDEPRLSLRWLFDVCDIVPALRHPDDDGRTRVTCAAVFHLAAERSIAAAGLGSDRAAREALAVLTRDLCGRDPADLDYLVDPFAAAEVADLVERMAGRVSQRS